MINVIEREERGKRVNLSTDQVSYFNKLLFDELISRWWPSLLRRWLSHTNCQRFDLSVMNLPLSL